MNKKNEIFLERTLIKRIELDDKILKIIHFDILLFPYNVEAYNFRDNYKKQKGSWKGWTYSYSDDPRYERPLEITWDFWEDYFKINVPCFECNKVIEDFDEYCPHHLKYTKKYWDLWHIVPLHSKCHKKGRFFPRYLDLYYILSKAIQFIESMNQLKIFK